MGGEPKWSKFDQASLKMFSYTYFFIHVLKNKDAMSIFSRDSGVHINKLPKTKKLVAPFDRGKSLGLLFFKKSDIMS